MTIEDVLATQSRVDIAKWLERGLRVQLHEQMQKGHDMRKPYERVLVGQEVMKQEAYWRVTPDRV